jgi:hypothetical protein
MRSLHLHPYRTPEEVQQMVDRLMQSLFVPTMLTASNRTAERDGIKDEADHRAWSHLYQPVSGSLLGQRLQRVALSVIWPEPISWLQRSCPHHDTAKEGVT